MAIKLPTTQEIDTLTRKAERGDFQAAKDLRESLTRLTRLANQRMRRLSAAGFDTAAKVRAEYFLQEEFGRKSFSASKQLSLDDASIMLEQTVQFLKWQTSTISGEKKRRENILKSLSQSEKAGYVSPKNKEEFLKFLDSDAWKELRLVSSREFIKEAEEKIDEGATVEDLEKLFRQYEEQKDEDKGIDIFELWDKWIAPEE